MKDESLESDANIDNQFQETHVSSSMLDKGPRTVTFQDANVAEDADSDDAELLDLSEVDDGDLLTESNGYLEPGNLCTVSPELKRHVPSNNVNLSLTRRRQSPNGNSNGVSREYADGIDIENRQPNEILTQSNIKGCSRDLPMKDCHTKSSQISMDITTSGPSNTTFINHNVDATTLPKIRVVVRKRPLNSSERQRGEEDIVHVDRTNESMILNETKVKVDLTQYVEKNEFSFDAILDDNTSNDEVYLQTVAPLVGSIFRRGRSTCFAYGQTGSGKTYTMSPLPTRAVHDIMTMMKRPEFSNLTLWMSNFEIYGGKVFDLLNERQKLCMREDGRQRVCIVGLQEFEVDSVEQVEKLIEMGHGVRSTGTTGANAESSRSHAIIQLVLRSAARQQREGRFIGKTVGKFSFIDLAGNERGADTYDNNKQTRLEGAEINKSLLALKECIRALDMGAVHIPFRGSKLTEVLRDSFMGNEARTVMVHRSMHDRKTSLHLLHYFASNMKIANKKH